MRVGGEEAGTGAGREGAGTEAGAGQCTQTIHTEDPIEVC